MNNINFDLSVLRPYRNGVRPIEEIVDIHSTKEAVGTIIGTLSNGLVCSAQVLSHRSKYRRENIFYIGSVATGKTICFEANYIIQAMKRRESVICNCEPELVEHIKKIAKTANYPIKVLTTNDSEIENVIIQATKKPCICFFVNDPLDCSDTANWINRITDAIPAVFRNTDLENENFVYMNVLLADLKYSGIASLTDCFTVSEITHRFSMALGGQNIGHLSNITDFHELLYMDNFFLCFGAVDRETCQFFEEMNPYMDENKLMRMRDEQLYAYFPKRGGYFINKFPFTQNTAPEPLEE